MVFCPEDMTDDLVIEKAQSLLKAYNRHYKQDGLDVKSSVSIGICRVNYETDNFQNLYIKTDKALYKAKENGRIVEILAMITDAFFTLMYIGLVEIQFVT